ncbi:unnamed protein product [Orchesella dallaii]|uniref:Protein kinase domain-containing protein n=1 Tax=Orchesella dallaii TaxID=48710 RepID=A0ABP1RVF3_9HEXA
MSPIVILIILNIPRFTPVAAHHEQQTSRHVSRVILDITRSLDAFTTNQITFADYVSEVNSAVRLISADDTLPTLYYATAKDTFDELVEEIRRVSKLVNETMRTTTGLHLMISCTIDVLTEQSISTRLTTVYKPYNPRNIRLSIVYNLHNEANCSQVKNELNGGWTKLLNLKLFYSKSRIPEHHNVKLGIGYSESLIDCNELYLDVMIDTDVTFTVLNIRFGDTIGVTESYSLFQQRLNVLHNKTAANHEKWRVKLAKEMIYNPMPDSVGENNHRRLLVRYADRWTATGNNDKNVIVQTPYTGDEPPKKNDFMVIPYLNNYYTGSETIHWGKTRWQFMVPVALESVLKGFNTLLLTHDQWTRLSSNEIKNLYDTVKTQASKVKLNIAIDFSDPTAKPNKVRLSGSQTWSTIEKELMNRNSYSNSKHIVLESLVFQFTNTSLDEYQPLVDSQFALRMSTKLKVGCSLRHTSFEGLNATAFVTACKSINGELYVLKWALTLNWREDRKNSYLYYENVLRRELMAINYLRAAIVNDHPEATVTFQLDVAGINKVGTADSAIDFLSGDVDNSLFCNPMIKGINKYFEAMIIWANAYNFPVILNSELNSFYSNNEHTGWFSFLRRYPHLKYDPSDAKFRSISDKNGPSYMDPDNNLTMDPCIEWTEGRPEVKNDHFHTEYIGAIFHTDGLKKEGTVDQEEFATMFEFIFHRFHLIEIVSSTNFQDVVEAVDYMCKEFPESVSNSTIFMSYVASDDSSGETSKFENFLNVLEGTPLISGIHIELLQYSKYVSNSGKAAPIDLTKYTALKTVFDEKVGGKTKFGIIVDLERCWEIVRYVILKTDPYDKGLELLYKADYLICQSETGAIHDYKEILQFQFDRHLYIKRVFQQLLPQLEVYFRIEADFELDKDPATMEKYLRLVAHFRKFGEAYDISYFMVEAFDNELGRKNGWWEMKNTTDLTDPKAYVEKEPVYLGRDMWYPTPTSRRNRNTFIYKDSPIIIIGLCASLFLLILLAVGGGVLYFRYRRLGRYLSDEEVEEFVYGRPVGEKRNTKIISIFVADNLKYNSEFEIPLSELKVDTTDVIGAGNFGTVYKGVARGVSAAVKQPNKNCEKSTFKNALSEIKVMGYIGTHPHIVKFLGAYTKEIRRGFLYISTELCINGSLEKLLRSKRFVASSSESSTYQNIQAKRESLLYSHNLHRFGMEIASGMEYIEKKQVVHGDLSSRNILLDENLTCKIADFGFSRKLYEYQRYVKKSQDPLPWKWMAFESLTKMEFTSKSDVWSYGVTLWEIYSLGETPYGGLHWTQEFADELRNGMRLKSPQFATQDIYCKMLDCWDLESGLRPNFAEMVTFFRQLCDNNYTVLDQVERYYEIRKGSLSTQM